MEHDTVPDASVPDSILPEQFFDRMALRTSDVPEKRLMFAVLLDAIIQLRNRNTNRAAEAERWIRGEDEDEETDAPFSFCNVCEALGINPGYLRRGLLAWRHQPGGVPVGVPARQLRTATRRVTPSGHRRRRRGPVRAGALPPTGRRVASGRRAT